MKVQESSVLSVVPPSEVVSDSSAHGFIAPNPVEEEIIVIEHMIPTINPALIIDEENATFDPASLIGVKLCVEDKEKLIKMKPCQPPESILSARKKKKTGHP